MKSVIFGLALLMAAGSLGAQASTEDLARQRETVGRILDLGRVWFEWLGENVFTEWPDGDPGPMPEDPASGKDATGRVRFDLRGTGRPLTHEEFLELLAPWIEQDLGGDAAEMPTHDAWGHPLEFRFRWDVLKPQVMSIRSPGRDGVYSGTAYSVGPYAVEDDVDADIVWADGFFIEYPKSVLAEVMAQR